MDTETALNPIEIKLNGIQQLKGLSMVMIAYTALRLLSLEKICKILRVCKPLCTQEIEMHEAESIWAAVRQSSFFFSGRVACLEWSLAFVLFALTQRSSATWCVGVATDPFRAHAWVEIDGKPFRETHFLEQQFRKSFAI